MKQWKTFCRQEWEIVTLLASGGVMILLVLIFALSHEDVIVALGGGGGQLGYADIIDARAYAFMERGGPQWSGVPTPFSPPAAPAPAPQPEVEPERPRQRPRLQPKPVEPPPPPPTPTKLGALPAVGDRPEPGQETPVPAAPAVESCDMTFTYHVTTSSGKATAVVSLKRPGAPPLTRSLGVGDEIEGIRILTISGDSLRIRDARGMQRDFRFSETWPVWARKKE